MRARRRTGLGPAPRLAPVAVVAAALLLLAPAAAPLGVADPTSATDAEAWQAKADDALRAAVEGGEGVVSVVVQGAPLSAPETTPGDRAAWRAHWAQASQPFLAWLAREAAQQGGTVTSEVAPVNAAFVHIDAARVPALLAHDAVRRAGLDTPDAVRILDDPGPGVSAVLGDTVAKVQAPALWAMGYRGEGVRLAIVDTGIRASHQTMRAADGTTRVVDWHDATGPAGACASACDTHGHGTHVASTAAGSDAYSASAPVGTAPEATLIGVRIFQGGSGPWEDAQEGLQAAFDLEADIASNSWGGGCSTGGVVTAQLAEELTRAGMMTVFAAGNRGTGGIDCPGMADLVLTVGAVDLAEQVAGFSSRGPCTWQGVVRTCPDVMAVGVDVHAAIHSCDTCYGHKSGTSMATPHVAGVVALLQQASLAVRGHGLDAATKQAEVLLRATARDLGPAGLDDAYGWGLVQAEEAHDLLVAPPAVQLDAELRISLPEMRARQTNVLTFTVLNLGRAATDGRLTHHAVQVYTGLCPPTCDAATFADQDLALGTFEDATRGGSFDGLDHAAGTYEVRGRYAYTATHPDTQQPLEGVVEAQASFVLRKVAWQVTRTAIAGEVASGTPLLGGLVLTNVGNDDAAGVAVVERFHPRGFAPLPVVPPGTGSLWGVLANPAPDRVNPGSIGPNLRYTWEDVGTVAAGTSWTASMNFLATEPGSYAFEARLDYRDGIGDAYTETFLQPVQVTTPGA